MSSLTRIIKLFRFGGRQMTALIRSVPFTFEKSPVLRVPIPACKLRSFTLPLPYLVV